MKKTNYVIEECDQSIGYKQIMKVIKSNYNRYLGVDEDYVVLCNIDAQLNNTNDDYEEYLYNLVKDHSKPKEIKWIRSIEKWLINIMYRFHKLKKSVIISFYKLEELWQMKMTKNK